MMPSPLPIIMTPLKAHTMPMKATNNATWYSVVRLSRLEHIECAANATAARPIITGKAPLQTIGIAWLPRFFLGDTFFLGSPCMRKLPASLENPVDNIFIAVGDAMCPTLKAAGHTPNLITTYSAAASVLALVALHRGDVSVFVTFWMLHVFWDCVDGHFARKYDMVTRAGDIYDHVTDISSTLGLLVIVWRRYDVPPLFMVVFAGLIAVNFVHLGCQQRHVGGGKGESLDMLLPMCPDTSWLAVTRWLSHGTMHVLAMLAIVYLEKHHKREPAI